MPTRWAPIKTSLAGMGAPSSGIHSPSGDLSILTTICLYNSQTKLCKEMTNAVDVFLGNWNFVIDISLYRRIGPCGLR